MDFRKAHVQFENLFEHSKGILDTWYWKLREENVQIHI
jgi:hypothetical protein